MSVHPDEAAFDAKLQQHDVEDDVLSQYSGSFLHLIFMSAAMFFGAFGFGYLPLLVQTSDLRMKLVNISGAGLLIGAALIVIIPEGFHMWFEATSGHSHDEHHHDEPEHEQGHEHEHAEHAHGHGPLGAALAMGFTLMLLVERLSGGHPHSHSHGSETLTSSGSDQPTTTTATFGLIIHAAIDGVALGAGSFFGESDASLVIFLAILLHKAPASFGLTTHLLSQGANGRAVRHQLLIFSLAAPVGAFAMYYFMSMGIMGYDQQTLALVMLFSAGTFLFIATAHILPEIMHGEAPLSWKEVGLLACGILFPVVINFNHGH